MKKFVAETTSSVYPIYVGSDLLTNSEILLSPIIKSPTGWRQSLIVTGSGVPKQYAETVRNTLREQGAQAEIFILDDSEKNKSLSNVSQLFYKLAELNYDRHCVLYSVGGGVLGDQVGFAAACWMRGVDYVNIPTTLLAQVDSSVGGKTGVNLPKGKNLVGAFHQPLAVIIDINTLSSLPDSTFIRTLSEIIKYGIVCDTMFFVWLEARLPQVLERDEENLLEAIYQSCRIKSDIVRKDEFEKGQRALLNLGHTFGHAIEVVSNFEITHGEAVYTGIHMALQASRDSNLIDHFTAERIQRMLYCIDLPDKLPPGVATERFIEIMLSDKKVEDGQLRLVLPTGIGEGRVDNLNNLGWTMEDLRFHIDRFQPEKEAPKIQ